MSFFILVQLFDLLLATCNFTAGTTVQYSEAIDCLKSHPVNPNSDEGRSYISIIRKYLESYAYRDIMLDPPAPYSAKAMDILAELDSLANNLPATGFEYMEQLKNIIGRLEDGHANFLPPCFTPFIFKLPYAFYFQCVADANGTVTTNNVYLFPISGTDTDLSYFQVLAVATDNQTYSEEEPWVVLSKYAETNIPGYRTPSARVNAGLKESFSIYPAAVAPIPSVGAIRLKLLNTSSNTVIERSLDFTVRITQDISTLDELCPLRHTNASSASYRGNQFLSQLAPYRNVSEDVEGLFTSFNAVQTTHKIKQTSLMERASLFNRILRSTVSHIKNEEQMRLEKMLKRQNTLKFANQSETLLNGLPSANYLHLSPLRANDDSSSGNSSEVPSLDVYTNNDSLVTGVITPANIGYISLDSFSPEDVNAVCKNIVNALLKFKKQNISHLVIDLTNNGGGYVALSSNFFRLLFPEKFPINPRLRVPYTDYAHWHFNDSDDRYTEYEDPNTHLTTVFDQHETITESGLNVTRSREWTRSFSLNSDSVDLFDFYTVDTDYHRKRFYEPDDVIVFTDGTCGSACSQFVKHVHETRAAKIIGRGPLHIDNDTIGYDVGSFAGGNVVDSESYESAMAVQIAAYERLRKSDPLLYEAAISSAVKDGISFKASFSGESCNANSGTSDGKDLPDFFPRSCTLRIDLSTSFSFNFSTYDEQLEFAIREPDAVVASYPNYFETQDNYLHLSVISELVSPYFDRCFSWQVHPTDECTAAVSNGSTSLTPIDHARYGHPCNESTNTFDTSTCVFAGCENGYYDRNGTCMEAKYSWSTVTETAETLATYIIIIIVVGALIIIGIIVVVVICCIVHHRRKKAKEFADHSIPTENDIIFQQNTGHYQTME